MPAGYMAGGFYGLAKQSAQGTPAAVTSFAPFSGETFDANPQTTEYGNGTAQGVAYSIVNGYSVKFGQSGIPLTSNFGLQVLYLVTGGTDTKSGAGDPYAHALTFANDLPWFTAERSFGNAQYCEDIQDCKMNSVTVAGKSADMCTLSYEGIGSYNPKQAIPASVSYDADAPFMFRDGTFTINGTSSLVQVAGFSIQIQRNIQTQFTNKVYPLYLIPRRRRIAVSLDVVWDASNAPTWYQAVVKNASTTTPTKVPYSGSLTLKIDPAATPDHFIQFVVSDLREVTATPKLDPQNLGIQMLNITGFAQIPSGGGDEIAITGQNLTSTAYSA